MPDVNSANDNEGYVHFVEPKEPFTEEQYHAWGVSMSTNPYEDLQNNDPAHILCTTLRCFHEHVMPKTKSTGNPVFDTTTTGKRIRDFYSVCMIRRSFVSKVDGRRIGDKIPALKHRRLLCHWANNEKPLYGGFAEEKLKKLIIVNKTTGKIQWNFRYYRHLLLITFWLGFEVLESIFLSDNLAKFIKQKHMLEKIVKAFVDNNTGWPLPTTLVGRLNLVCGLSPKLRVLVPILSDVVVQAQKKAIIFASLPAQQMLLYAILQALNISSEVYHAGLSPEERETLRTNFDDEVERQVLIATYAVAGCGLNLQKNCHIG